MGTKILVISLLVYLSILEIFGSPKRDRNRKPYRVVCYYGSWANDFKGDGQFLVKDIDPFKCTHIIYAFAKLEDNMIASSDPWLDLKTHWGQNGYHRLNSLRKRNPELTTMIGIGGWEQGPAEYSQMAKTAKTRKIFVESVLTLLKLHDFDGLDFDWEFPGARNGSDPAVDKKNYVHLVKELRDAFKEDGYVLSAAVSAEKHLIDIAYDIPQLSHLFDFISVKAYDFHGGWETYTAHNAPLFARPDEKERYLNVDYGVRYWLKHGAPPKKLVLGIATFGRSFTLKDSHIHGFNALTSAQGNPGSYTNELGMLGYNEICMKLRQEPWNIIFDLDTSAPYAYFGNQWVAYDDERSVTKKTEYVLRKGLSGAMVWSLETDDFAGHCFGSKFPLLSTIVGRLEKHYRRY